MQITTASADDISEMTELLSLLFAQETEFTPNLLAQARGLGKIVAEPQIGIVLVAKMEGRVVGMINLLFTISTALGEKVGIVDDVIVSPAQRGKGIGSALLKAVIEKARELGCKRLTLNTDRENHTAREFYERHGFVRSEMIPFRLALE